uniref:Uncharacterized protein n=1 Tax=Avena sativa TaxID=4498 RepID=A0ACD5U2Z7_AVESA
MDASLTASRNVQSNTKQQLALVPVIDLLSPGSAGAIADACRSHGFFKAVNHGMAVGITETLEAEAMAFFALPRGDKINSSFGFTKPLGYGCGNIGTNGDVGSLEYLIVSDTDNSTPTMPIALCHAMDAYMTIVQEVAGRVLELMAEGLGMEDTNVFRGMVHRDGSDELLRLNHYPPSRRLEEAPGTGFGEHTDPQLMSLLRSNSVSGLQIALPDGTWLPVAPDTESVFVNVGDAMQVLTNGRYRSVRHRVVAEPGTGEADVLSRLSTIYFGGPAPAERIVPVAGLMGALEVSEYMSFTWEEYKSAAYKTKLGACRLEPFLLKELGAEETTATSS